MEDKGMAMLTTEFTYNGLDASKVFSEGGAMPNMVRTRRLSPRGRGVSTFLSRHYLPADGCNRIRPGAVALREHLLARLIERRSGDAIAPESMEYAAFLSLADKHVPPAEAAIVSAVVDAHVCCELYKRWLRERDGELDFAQRVLLLREIRGCNRDLMKFLGALRLESDGVADTIDAAFQTLDGDRQ
jgi:hypothetical protein